MFEMQELDTINEFDEKLWLTIIDTVTVHAGATRHESARPDRDDGLRRRIMAFAGVLLGQIP